MLACTHGVPVRQRSLVVTRSLVRQCLLACMGLECIRVIVRQRSLVHLLACMGLECVRVIVHQRSLVHQRLLACMGLECVLVRQRPSPSAFALRVSAYVSLSECVRVIVCQEKSAYVS